MTLLLTIAAVYVAVGFFRAIYRLATGFFYTAPKGYKYSRKYYKPLVTVIIPAWNEAVGINRTVQSVLQNGYKKIEIIVVDDGSTDNTALIIDQLIGKSPQKIRYIYQVNTGKAGALNNGIAHASGGLILTLDADSFLQKDSIDKMVRVLSDKKYSVAIGEVVVGNFNSWLGRAQHFEYTVGFHVKRGQHVFNSAYIFPGALTMFRKSVLREIGDFRDYSSTEDLDISMRIKMAGHKIAYIDSAICITEGASTITGLLNQRTRWRHGYLDCLWQQKMFLISPKKGWYLTLVDLPMQLFGLLELFMFPAILAVLIYLSLINPNPLALLAGYSIVPFVLPMLGDLRNGHRQLNLWIFAMPFMLIVLESLEYIALLKSIYRKMRRRRTTWTIWQRTGAVS